MIFHQFANFLTVTFCTFSSDLPAGPFLFSDDDDDYFYYYQQLTLIVIILTHSVRHRVCPQERLLLQGAYNAIILCSKESSAI